MESDYWLQRWQVGNIGFHATEVNDQLKEIWPYLQIPQNTTVFAPLSGKSLDLVWLRQQGHPVVGVEISELACRQFFSDQHIAPEIAQTENFRVFKADGYTLYCGDFFEFSRNYLPENTCVFDRASLVAFPPEMRHSYAQKMDELMTNNATMLLISLRYSKDHMDGPPFSLETEDIRSLYSHSFQIQPLKSVNRIDMMEKFKERGLTEIWEETYKLTKIA